MSRVRKALVPAVMIAAGVLLIGCNPGPNPSITHGPGSDSSAIGISGDSMQALATNPSKWSAGKKVKRRCDGGFWCWLGTKKVNVEIFAEVDSKDDGPSTSSTPVLVGKLVNLGDAQEEMYGLANGPYHYMLWVVPGGTHPDTGRFEMVQVDTTTGAKQTIASGIQVGCGHTHTWSSSFALFWGCDRGLPPEPSAARTSAGESHGIRRAGLFSFTNILSLVFGGEDPAWFTCTSGCCTSGEPQ